MRQPPASHRPLIGLLLDCRLAPGANSSAAPSVLTEIARYLAHPHSSDPAGSPAPARDPSDPRQNR